MTLQLKMAEPGGPLQVHWAPAELVQASPGVGQEIPSRQLAMPPSRPELEDPPPPPLDEAELPPLVPAVVPPVCDVDDCAPPAPPELPDVPPEEDAPVPRLLHARSNPPTNIGIRAELLDIAFSFGTTGHSWVREGHLRTWLDIDDTPIHHRHDHRPAKDRLAECPGPRCGSRPSRQCSIERRSQCALVFDAPPVDGACRAYRSASTALELALLSERRPGASWPLRATYST